MFLGMEEQHAWKLVSKLRSPCKLCLMVVLGEEDRLMNYSQVHYEAEITFQVGFCVCVWKAGTRRKRRKLFDDPAGYLVDV